MIDPFEAMMAYHRAENNRASKEDWSLLAASGVRKTVILETVGVTYELSCERNRVNIQKSATGNSFSKTLSNS
jgi:hypothetical protein